MKVLGLDASIAYKINQSLTLITLRKTIVNDFFLKPCIYTINRLRNYFYNRVSIEYINQI